MTEPVQPILRPERSGTPVAQDAFGVVEQPLTLGERAWNNGALRKTALLLLLALAWEGYAGGSTIRSWFHLQRDPPGVLGRDDVGSAPRPDGLLRPGPHHGLFRRDCARHPPHGLRGQHADRHRSAGDAQLHVQPLPAIALLPLALLWFGLGNPSLMFVMVHSVLWPVASTRIRVPGGLEHLAHGGAELRPDRRPVHREDPHPAAFPVFSPV